VRYSLASSQCAASVQVGEGVGQGEGGQVRARKQALFEARELRYSRAQLRTMLSAEDIRAVLKRRLAEAASQGKQHLDVKSGDLHREVGGYPAQDHRMPLVCEVMKGEMKPGDQIIVQPPSGKGAPLTIRYCLPR